MGSDGETNAYRDGEWQVSTRVLTASCEIRGGQIVKAAPIIRLFVGQPFGNLLRWAGRQSGLRVYPIGVAESGKP